MAEVQYLNVSYDFIDDGKGNLMMVMDAQEGTADDDNAKIIYDGNTNQATLIRNSNQVVRLPILVENVRDMLTDGREDILVTEMNGDEIADVYEAKLEILNADTEEDNSPILTENFYDILQNSAGELLFCIRDREGEPVDPEILYSGGVNALLRRRPDQSILLDEVHPDVREALSKADEALIAEFNPPDEERPPSVKEDGILREYTVKIRHVSETLESVKSIINDGYPIFSALRAKVNANADKPIAEVIEKDDYINLCAVLAREEDYKLLDKYFAEGLPINGLVSREFKSWQPTPLFYVSTKGVVPLLKEPVKMLNYLVKHGADPNMASGEGDTPLGNQCYSSGKVEIMKALLEAGADPNKQNYISDTESYISPLFIVLCPEEYDEETHKFKHLTQIDVERAKLLIEAGANVNEQTAIGETPLGLAITYSQVGEQAELVDLLIKKGADVEAALEGMERIAEGGNAEFCYALYDFYSGLQYARNYITEDITKWKDGDKSWRFLKLGAEAGNGNCKSVLDYNSGLRDICP